MRRPMKWFQPGGSAEGFSADVTCQDSLDALFAHISAIGQPLEAVGI